MSDQTKLKIVALIIVAIMTCLCLWCEKKASAKTVTPPKTAEFTAYEATLDGDTAKVKKVIVLQDNKNHQEFILVPGYGMGFRWQDGRSIGE